MQNAIETVDKNPFLLKFRLLSILPLVFFIAHLRYHYNQGAASNIFWMCNISILTLSLGLFLNKPFVIRVSALWLTLGFPLWIIDLMQFWETPITTFLVHIGGVCIALYSLKYIGFSRNLWLHSFVWYLTVQQFCRICTPISLNVNLAHSSRSFLGIIITNYFLYWIITSILVILLLFIFSNLLGKIFVTPTLASQKIS